MNHKTYYYLLDFQTILILIMLFEEAEGFFKNSSKSSNALF